MSFICPVCKKTLTKEEKCYRCESGHLFDRARSGYVNLLTPDKMNSKAPGDSKEMVASRRNFLLKGYYEPLLNALTETAKKYSPKSPVYLDAGCGTGYYTNGVSLALGGKTLAVDISKSAVDTASKYTKDGDFAVASVYSLPIPDNSVDIITNVFSPMADAEYARVLKKGGLLLYVVPAPEHLLALKTMLYENAYLNSESNILYNGLKEIEKIKVEFDLYLSSSEDVLSLFKMTPYSWRTPAGAEEKINSTPSLRDKASFYLLVFEKC